MYLPFHQVWGKGGKPVFVELDMVAAQNDDDGGGGGGGSGGDGVCWLHYFLWGRHPSKEISEGNSYLFFNITKFNITNWLCVQWFTLITKHDNIIIVQS